MAKPSEPRDKGGAKSGAGTTGGSRDERLAAALRANLSRRKAQERARVAADADYAGPSNQEVGQEE